MRRYAEGLDLTFVDEEDITGVFRPGAETELVPGGRGKAVQVGHIRLTLALKALGCQRFNQLKVHPFQSYGFGCQPAPLHRGVGVTSGNVAAYARALVARRVVLSVERQTAAFAAGFSAVVPPALRLRMSGMLTGAELAEFIAGSRDIDLADWRRHAAYAEPLSEKHFSAECFWRAVEDLLTPAEHRRVLEFTTGLSCTPAVRRCRLTSA